MLSTILAYGQPNKSWFYGSNRAGSEVNSTTTVNDGAWHFVVGVYDASSNTQSIYVDGAPADGTSATQPILANGAPFLIGGYNLAGTATGFYTGLVDDVQVYNMALNDDHISFLFNNPGIAVPEPAAAALLWFATLIGVGRRVRR
ncbi:MAG: LamG domain-containing protein [Pirellulaceae bacterium]